MVLAAITVLERAWLAGCQRPAFALGKDLSRAQSYARGFLALARRFGIWQLLRPLSPGETLGVGNVLACRRIFQLDHCTLVAGSCPHPRSLCRAQGITSHQSVLGLCFRPVVGTRGTHLRLNNALPRYVSRNGRCPRIYSSFRNFDAADLPRTL